MNTVMQTAEGFQVQLAKSLKRFEWDFRHDVVKLLKKRRKLLRIEMSVQFVEF